jgi:3-oxoacyl-[acyl-carrier-protein] synthase II
MKHRVVITGMGIVCPLGNDVPAMWDSLITGRSGMNYTTIFDASTFPTQFDAEVKNYDLGRFVKNVSLHSKGNRGSQFVIGAAAQACRQAGIDIETDRPADGIDRRRMGIYLGAGEGSVNNDAFFSALVDGWQADKNNMDWTRWARTAYAGGARGDAHRSQRRQPQLPDGLRSQHPVRRRGNDAGSPRQSRCDDCRRSPFNDSSAGRDGF